MYKFAFIILNYKSENETKLCIETILNKCQAFEKKIVVIDNCSGDLKCKEMIDSSFSGNREILYRETTENKGFANGNNFGFSILKESGFDADFFIFENSDAYIVSNDFCQQIIKNYESKKFSLLGPRIILGNNTIDSYPFEPINYITVKRQIKYCKRIIFFTRNNILWCMLKILRFLKEINKSKKSVFIDKSRELSNVLLQGAFLIFSKEYFAHYNFPFDSRTFLYKEEELLYIRLQNMHLLSIYQPDLIVYHEGGKSTKRSTKNARLGCSFKYHCYLNSLRILEEELLKNTNE